MDRCILEVAGRSAGLLVREGRMFVFYAALPEAAKLNGHMFCSIRRAETALRTLLSPSGQPGRSGTA